MTTTTTETATETTAAAGDPVADAADVQAAPVLGEIIVKTHDGARCVAWTLGHHAAVHGLTVAGIAAAARASAEFLEGLSEARQQALGTTPGPTQLRIGATEWSVPLLPALAPDIEALMIEVVNAEGSIGRIA